MDALILQAPQSANDYDDRTTAAVKSVLVEIGQILGSFRGKFAVIGGSVPWLLLEDSDAPHVGTLDVDLSLDADALQDGQYADMINEFMSHGYYDVHYCVRNYPGGPAALAEDCKLLLHHESAMTGYGLIASKFDSVEGYGPTSVRTFVEESAVQGGLTPDQWQQDAFGQVRDWLLALGLRPQEG